jgi:hypothetical protein
MTQESQDYPRMLFRAPVAGSGGEVFTHDGLSYEQTIVQGEDIEAALHKDGWRRTTAELSAPTAPKPTVVAPAAPAKRKL